MIIAPDTVIRTLGLYQPYASLMLHGKIETRLVEINRKPPFVKGKYLIYSTKKRYTLQEVSDISGAKQFDRIESILRGEPTRREIQKAICIGDLVDVRRMVDDDEDKTFVEYAGAIKVFKKGEWKNYRQWCLVFENVQRIIPFEFKDANGASLGKQGVGKFPVELYNKIKIAS